MTRVEISLFAHLETGVTRDQKRELLEEFLSRYGETESDVADYFGRHFEDCDSCREIYEARHRVSRLVKLGGFLGTQKETADFQ